MSGDCLDHYELIEEVGRGGGGFVWKARDTKLGREVAIKILSTEKSLDPDRRKRFFREAQAASNLNHPNIVTIHEISSDAGKDFIVMEYVRGESLSRWIAPGGMNLADVLDIAVQISNGLAKAHSAGVVHRDIKPSNIMVDGDGRVKILDFGLAKLMPSAVVEQGENPEAAALHTLDGVIIGTVSYMSPEQATGREVDARSDIFSFGALLYEMLTGRKPFKGDTDRATLRQICSSTPPAPERLRPGIPHSLCQLLARLLEKEPGKRYQNMADVAKDLLIIQGGKLPGTALPVSDVTTVTIERPPVHPSRRRRLIAALSLLAALIAVSLIPSVRNQIAAWIQLVRGTDTSGAFESYTKGKEALQRYDRKAKLELAMKLFREAMRKDKNYALAYAGLAEAMWRQYRENPDDTLLANALETARQAVRLGDHFAITHAILGAIQWEKGDRQNGRDSLLRALDLDPRCEKAHYMLALSNAVVDNWEQAGAPLNKALELGPDNWANHSLRAFIFHRRNQYREAIASYQEALRLAPDNAQVWRDISVSFEMAGRTEDAASALQQSLSIEPSHRAYSNLGTLRFFQGQYAESARLMEKAIEMGATRYLMWGNLADAYRWVPGEEEKSKKAFKVALRQVQQWLDTHPEDASAKSTLAVYLAKTGQPEKGLAIMDTLPESARNRADIQYEMSVICELAGMREKALQQLELCLNNKYVVEEIEADPELRNLRRDPQYQLLLTKFTSGRRHK